MLTDAFTLPQALLSLENTLRIEYTENDVSRVIKDAKQRLENAYQCRLDKPVYTVQAENALVSENLNVFMQELSAGYKQITALISHSIWEKHKIPLNLADVNYLGFTSETINTLLNMLCDSSSFERKGNSLAAVTNALNSVEMCQIKRLFIVMLTLDELGMTDVAAACAQLLYLGGKAL